GSTQPRTSTYAAHIDARSGRTTLIRPPRIDEGIAMWRIARDSQTLDLNSSYAYVLYARDFADTCRTASVHGPPAAVVLGYRRPNDESCLFIWQVAVDADSRGLGLAGRMLDDLLHDDSIDPPVRTIHTTITDDNIASQNTFRSLAKRWGDAPVAVTALF